MFANSFHRLIAVSSCFRISDQLIVAGVPLVAAAVFKLPEDQIGAMVAAQGSAWLFTSLPAGVAIDRITPLLGMQRALVISVAGFLMAIGGYLTGSPVVFTFGAFLTAAAVVIGYLSEATSVQRLVEPQALGAANAKMQIVQSCAMLIGPSLMGFLIAQGYALTGLIVALGLALAGLVISIGFPKQDPPPARERAVLEEVKEGFAFVQSQPLLRGIVACALFWNSAFLALAAVFVPYALRKLSMDTGSIGFAQSAMGLGALLAAFTAAWSMQRFPPRFLLFFGPASSTLAATILYFAPDLGGFASSVTVYFLLGFGPILWLVCQNTIRQLVTPKGMLGRVGAVIQLAIYGVRSIGALAGGWVAARYGHEAAITMIIVLFALSTLTIPLSALGRLAAMPHSAG
jgi:predicted MFS family arabinose efflux permease